MWLASTAVGPFVLGGGLNSGRRDFSVRGTQTFESLTKLTDETIKLMGNG